MSGAVFALAALQMVSSLASPQTHPPSDGGGTRWGFVGESAVETSLAYERQAKALQAEMHALQAIDGGRLTPEHRHYLKQKAKALLAAYGRDVQLGPSPINADGSRPD